MPRKRRVPLREVLRKNLPNARASKSDAYTKTTLAPRSVARDRLTEQTRGCCVRPNTSVAGEGTNY